MLTCRTNFRSLSIAVGVTRAITLQPARYSSHFKMPGATSPRPPKKLVLCFDGTGNTFQGSTSDTNVVKIYDKLDRSNTEDQYHYYQTGIGTYDISGGSVNKNLIGSIQSSISSTLDQGFATTFDAHVMAGYRFLMRYYDQGDKIWMFGFSRGAFTARFLARMIYAVGLLSKGNEELVPFAYKLYQSYEQGEVNIDDKKSEPAQTNGNPSEIDPLIEESTAGPKKTSMSEKKIKEMAMKKRQLKAFISTFCREDSPKIEPADDPKSADHPLGVLNPIKVHFLGLFDCVSSVQVLEAPFPKPPKPIIIMGTALHVRHAVAIDERRVKFKAALLKQERPNLKEDIKEVWFPGNHGDVGGGWPAPNPKEPKSTWKWLKLLLGGHKPDVPPEDPKNDPFQMSDIALHWMMEEIDKVGKEDEDSALKWNEMRSNGFRRNFEDNKNNALNARAHDTLSFARGSAFIQVLFWKFMEYLPFMPRWEIKDGGFYYHRFTPNMGSRRDIPPDAVFHQSVLERLRDYREVDKDNNRIENQPYRPQNTLGENSKKNSGFCLTNHDCLVPVDKKDMSLHHRLYKLKPS